LKEGIVGFLDWLLGKKEQAVTAAAPAPRAAAPAAPEKAPPPSNPERPKPPPDPPAVRETRPAAPAVSATPPAAPEKQKPPSEAENLRRWRESGQLRVWVEAHRGQWGHAEWLALLEELRRSPYGPMQPDAVGLALEEAKGEWLSRN
jgi:hypothetical protein